MAATGCRTLPRVLTALHTNTRPVLRLHPRPYAHAPTPRTINSFHGLQGLVQPLQVPTENEEERRETLVRDHFETKPHWQSKEELLYHISVLSEAVAEDTKIESGFHEQIFDLEGGLTETEVLNANMGWLGTTDF